MADVGQKFRLHAAGFQRFLTTDHQFTVADFQFVEGFLQVAGGLFNAVLVLGIGALQSIGHGVDTGCQLAEFSAGLKVNARLQFAVFQILHGPHHLLQRIGNLTAGTDRNKTADQQGQQNNGHG